MLDLNGLTLLPERIIEVGGKNGLVNVMRDYCWISHIEGRFRQDLQNFTGLHANPEESCKSCLTLSLVSTRSNSHLTTSPDLRSETHEPNWSSSQTSVTSIPTH